ncbi:putative non-specific serine/threonine protein kinase [Helianthus debilis subsp. tardiflorus]
MVAHISNFWLAKFLPLKPHQSSSIGIRGTVGYAAPEYGVANEMTKEGGIYTLEFWDIVVRDDDRKETNRSHFPRRIEPLWLCEDGVA